MGARAGGNGNAGMGESRRGVGLNVIDNSKQMATGDLLRMSEEGGLGGALATKELNARITIEKTGNLVFRNPDGKLVAYKGFSMKLGDAGYVGFKSGIYSNTKKTLKTIMDAGGLTAFKASEIYKPVGKLVDGRFVSF